MSDRREEILKSNVFSGSIGNGEVNCEIQEAKNAMDEYMKECCLELLEYMIKKDAVPCVMVDEKGNETAGFSVDRGKFVTKEQLFENFL